MDFHDIINNSLELARRMRPGFRAFCASLDLLGMKRTIAVDQEEAIQRLDDFQQGFGDALQFYPGGNDYRVCFLGDSLFIVKELQPEEKNEEAWQLFCGHLFALASWVQTLEKKIGNPGLRMTISYGSLFQIVEPDSWRRHPISDYTKNWFVLTGASEALVKCHEIEQQGQAHGFAGGYCWHEVPSNNNVFNGTPFFKVPINGYQRHGLAFYSNLNIELCEKATRSIELKSRYE